MTIIVGLKCVDGVVIGSDSQQFSLYIVWMNGGLKVESVFS